MSERLADPSPALQTEKELRNLRIGLKTCCVVVSVFLSLKLYFSVSMVGPAREMFSDMGATSLPGIAKPLFGHPYFLHGLLLLSLASLVGIILSCFRSRNGAFLIFFAISMALHLILITWIDLAIKLPFLRIIQDLQSF